MSFEAHTDRLTHFLTPTPATATTATTTAATAATAAAAAAAAAAATTTTVQAQFYCPFAVYPGERRFIGFIHWIRVHRLP